MYGEEPEKWRLPRAQFSTVVPSGTNSRKHSPGARTPFGDNEENDDDSHEFSTTYAPQQSKLQVQTDLLSLVISENSSSVESQDEQDFQIQEKILCHFIEPDKLFKPPPSPGVGSSLVEGSAPSKKERSLKSWRPESGSKPKKVMEFFSKTSSMIKSHLRTSSFKQQQQQANQQQEERMREENQTKYRIDSVNRDTTRNEELNQAVLFVEGESVQLEETTRQIISSLQKKRKRGRMSAQTSPVRAKPLKARQQAMGFHPQRGRKDSYENLFSIEAPLAELDDKLSKLQEQQQNGRAINPPSRLARVSKGKVTAQPSPRMSQPQPAFHHLESQTAPVTKRASVGGSNELMPNYIQRGKPITLLGGPILKPQHYDPQAIIGMGNNSAVNLINSSTLFKKKREHDEYLFKLEQSSFIKSSNRLCTDEEGFDAQTLLTQRDQALLRRQKQQLMKTGLKVAELVYNTLAESKNGFNLGQADPLIKMPLLCKKLNKILNPRLALFFISGVQRKALFVHKCEIYEKWVPFVQKEIGVSNKNRFNQNNAKFIYNYVKDIAFGGAVPPPGYKALDETTIQQIRCDLARTNTTQRVKTQKGQEELERVLRSIAFMFPSISYTQGMNFICSVILSIVDYEEYLAFYVFIHFLQDKNLKAEQLFFSGLPELHVMNFTFEKCIQKNCQKLYSHFREVEMKTEFFTFKWNITLFSCFLPIDILPHVFDLFLLDGWPAIYKIGVSLLNNFMAQKLLGMDTMMEMCQYFRDDVRKNDSISNGDVHQIIIGAEDYNITKEDLLKYKEAFYIKLAQQKMNEQSKDFGDLKKLGLEKEQAQKPNPTLKKNRSPNNSPAKIRSQAQPTHKSAPLSKPMQVPLQKMEGMSDKEFTQQVIAQAKLKLDQMDPHAKEDILRYQEKIQKLDRALDRSLKDKMERSKEYRQVKTEYSEAICKKKALQSTLLHIIDQYNATLKRMSGLQTLLETESRKQAAQPTRKKIGSRLFGDLSFQKKEASYLIEQTMTQIQETQQMLDTQESELIGTNKRLKNLQVSLDLIKENYLRLRRIYYPLKVSLEQQIKSKERVAAQMNGFLLMYELKRHQTFKVLSEQLKQTEKFKREHQF